MDRLVLAYLEYRAKDTGDGMPSTQPQAPSGDSKNCQILDISLVDVFCMCLLLSWEHSTNFIQSTSVAHSACLHHSNSPTRR